MTTYYVKVGINRKGVMYWVGYYPLFKRGVFSALWIVYVSGMVLLQERCLNYTLYGYDTQKSILLPEDVFYIFTRVELHTQAKCITLHHEYCACPVPFLKNVLLENKSNSKQTKRVYGKY